MNTNEFTFAKDTLETTSVIDKLQKVINMVLKYPIELETKFGSNYIMLYEKKTYGCYETTDNLITNPITKYLFKEARLYANLFYNEKDKYTMYFDINIEYWHPDGGSNGHKLFTVVYDIENDIALIR